MDQRISLITLGVTDLSRACAFYERLGWVRGMKDAEGVAFFQAGGVVFSLFPRAELAKDAGVPDSGAAGFNGMALAYNTRTRDEVDRVLAEAVAAGGKLVKPGQDAFWGGYSGYFADTEGFLWEVAWNPGFAMDEEGRMTLPE